jgi:phosphatidylserine/phosphatidylglycerophosphate/cardiolipin synthase-like enzyme
MSCPSKFLFRGAALCFALAALAGPLPAARPATAAVLQLVTEPAQGLSPIYDLIGSAGASLLVENEEMSDDAVVSALCAAAGRGVAVRIVMTDRGKYARQFGQLQDAGAQLALYPDSADLYIHAKVVLADYGTAGAQVFIGSENFSQASLTRNLSGQPWIATKSGSPASTRRAPPRPSRNSARRMAQAPNPSASSSDG